MSLNFSQNIFNWSLNYALFLFYVCMILINFHFVSTKIRRKSFQSVCFTSSTWSKHQNSPTKLFIHKLIYNRFNIFKIKILLRTILRFIINGIKFEKLRLWDFKIFIFLTSSFRYLRHDFLYIFYFKELFIKTLTLNRVLHGNSIARRELSLSKNRVHPISL